MSTIAGINPTDLVYLSCPFGGDPRNLEKAIEHLAWAHANTPWGLYVQAPWIASAMAEVQRGTTETQWKEMGGLRVERAVLNGYRAVLHRGVPSIAACTAGMAREGRYMAKSLWRRVYQVIDGKIIETTGHWR